MLILLGYGKTNQALAKEHGPCCVFDDAFDKESYDAWGNALLPQSKLALTLQKYPKAQIITTPGIPPFHPLIQATNPISEYDFFAPLPYSIWISGTNGKTTTTQMLTSLLAKYGAVCGGNIGTPLALLDKRAPIWILETSSFMLFYTKQARPDFYILLPILSDHLSWHGSYESYLEAKLKPLLWLRDKQMALLPSQVASHPFVKRSLGELVFYDNSHSLAQAFGLDCSKIAFQEPFLLDALLALATAKILFGSVDYEVLNACQIGPHKLEEFYDKEGFLWVDDSKATNIDATLQAIKCYANKNIYLILGGDDKGVDMGLLFDELGGYALEVFAIGANARQIDAICKQRQIACTLCFELKEACKAIRARHNSKSVGLLSPAASSLDQFQSYKHRGECFKAFVLDEAML